MGHTKNFETIQDCIQLLKRILAPVTLCHQAKLNERLEVQVFARTFPF